MPGLEQVATDAVALLIALPALGFLAGYLLGRWVGR